MLMVQAAGDVIKKTLAGCAKVVLRATVCIIVEIVTQHVCAINPARVEVTCIR